MSSDKQSSDGYSPSRKQQKVYTKKSSPDFVKDGDKIMKNLNVVDFQNWFIYFEKYDKKIISGY